MGRPRSPQDFHKKKAGQNVYAGEEDNYNDYLEEEDILNENRNNKKATNEYLNKTKDDTDNVAKEAIVLFVFALLIAFPKIFKSIFHFVRSKIINLKNKLNNLKTDIKNDYAENRKSDAVKNQNKKKKLARKKSKNASTSVKEEAKVIVNMEPEFQEEEDAEIVQGNKDEVPTDLQESSNKVAVFISSPIECLCCKTTGGKESPLKKCRGCR